METLLETEKGMIEKSNILFSSLTNEKLRSFIEKFYSAQNVEEIAKNLYHSLCTRSKFHSKYNNSPDFEMTNGITFEEFSKRNLNLFTYDIRKRLTTYEDIRISQATCQYCYTATVNSLDHYFDKDMIPELSVFPDNLVPICANCNSKKNNHSVHFVYPYFTFLKQNNWLECKISLLNSKYTDQKFRFNIFVNTNISTSNVFEQELLADLKKQFLFLQVNDSAIQSNDDYFIEKIYSIQDMKESGIDKKVVKFRILDKPFSRLESIPNNKKNICRMAIVLGIKNNFDFIWENL